ncbi:hypothetical protein BaRGS_00000016, partial [Batillaria attramentaria]
TKGGCTKLGRLCIKEADCVDKNCVCPEQGSGEFACADDEDFLCEVTADPHVNAYGHARGSLFWPCRYRLTRFVTPLEGGVPGWSSCSFEVFGVNWVNQRGRYYARAVEISLAIGDMAQQVFIQQDIVKFDINYLGIADSLGHNAPWGSGPNPDVWNDIEIICTFDDEDMFAILDIPRCNVQIKFRPHNPDDEPGPQRKVPGISIETGQNTGFGFGWSLCGETLLQGDGPDLYSKRAEELGLDNVNQVLLFEALSQELDQVALVSTAENLIPDPVQCTNSIELFNNCGGGVGPKVEAIRCCHKILKRKKTVKCLGKDNVLQAFNDCLEVSCHCDELAFDNLKALFAEKNCKIPRRVRKCFRLKCDFK